MISTQDMEIGKLYMYLKWKNTHLDRSSNKNYLPVFQLCMTSIGFESYTTGKDTDIADKYIQL